MRRREVVQLVEAARALGVRIIPKPGNPNAIVIHGRRDEFPNKLRQLALALEMLDKAGSASMEDGANDPTMDAASLRLALDGVFRWMRSTGIDVREPHAVVAAALGVKGEKRGKSYKAAPKFAAEKLQKFKKPKPLLKLMPGPGEPITVASLRQREVLAEMVEVSLGQAAPMRR